MMATSKKRTITKLTPDEEKEEADLKDRVCAAFAISHMMFLRDEIQAEQNQPTSKKRKTVEENDSKETLEFLLKWIKSTTSENPTESIVGGDADVAERCSKPIRKQLTESDVKEDQNRLMLGKVQVEKKIFTLLKNSEIPREKNGLEVTVYGPDGEVNEMMFKMWNQKTPVLTSGWNKFVAKYGLKMHCDFLTIWMFRHKISGNICFAIDSTRLPIRRQLSRRISNAAFKDSN